MAVVAAAALAGSGCGGSGSPARGPSRPQSLSAADRAAVRDAQNEIHAYCRSVASYLAGRTPPPSRETGERASDAVRQLGSIARAKPDARYKGETVGEVMGDIAEDLEGSNCSNELAAELDAELRSVPQPRN